MTTFKIPETIHFGENSLATLASLSGTKAIIVTGGSSISKYTNI